MAGVTIHLHPEDGAPTADVLTISAGSEKGRSFVSLDISASLSLIPAGRDWEAVASARALADALTGAADTLERALAVKAADQEAITEEIESLKASGKVEGVDFGVTS